MDGESEEDGIIVRWFILTQYRRQSDRQTDRRTDGQTNRLKYYTACSIATRC